MAKAREIPGLNPDESYAAAAARTVSVRAAELREHAAGVLDTEDIERVHDMRVATRRLRAALEVFELCFERKRFKAALKEVKRLADALGERRDRDVALARLAAFQDRVPAPDRPGIETLVTRLRAEQGEANESLVPWVVPERLDALVEGLTDLAEHTLAAAPEELDPDGIRSAAVGAPNPGRDAARSNGGEAA